MSLTEVHRDPTRPVEADARSYSPLVKVLILAYVVGISALYVFVRGHTPVSVSAGAPHDDTLFMTLGRFLSAGHWLGGYSQFTLVKGPGYPAFLALVNWTGLSTSMATALLHSTAVVLLTLVSHRFIKSLLISGLFFTLVLWHPVSVSLFLLRILRDTIYYSQALLALAIFIAVLFIDRLKHRLLLAAVGGAVLGWFYLTREEGIWFFPSLFLLFGAAVLHAFPAKRVRKVAAVTLMAVAVFAAVQVGFRALNWHFYGYFVGVDFKETQYQRALRAIHSVRSGGVKPSISITKEGREAIYNVSPSFAALKYYLDGQPGRDWAGISCDAIGFSCDEIGVGHFIFAVREAVGGIGKYDAPAEAAAFYKNVADEINTACNRGQLVCYAQPINEVPPLTWQIVKDNLRWELFLRTFRVLLFLNPPKHVDQSSPDVQIAKYLKFLNYPAFQKVPTPPMHTYTLHGWYFRGTQDWIQVSVRDQNGDDVPVRLDRNSSQDLLTAFKSENAGRQRFTIRTLCHDECVLNVETRDWATAQHKLGEFRPQGVGFHVGDGRFHVDMAAIDPLATGPSPPEKASLWIRERVLTYYQYVFLPILVLGAVAFLVASLLFWRRSPWNVCYVLALVCWAAVAMRLLLLDLMAITMSTPIIMNHLYAAPSFFFLVAASVYSIAAAMQLFNSRHHSSAAQV